VAATGTSHSHSAGKENKFAIGCCKIITITVMIDPIINVPRTTVPK